MHWARRWFYYNVLENCPLRSTCQPIQYVKYLTIEVTGQLLFPCSNNFQVFLHLYTMGLVILLYFKSDQLRICSKDNPPCALASKFPEHHQHCFILDRVVRCVEP